MDDKPDIPLHAKWNRIIRKSDLCAVDRAVVRTMMEWANLRTGHLRPSVESIVEGAGFGRRCVQQSLKRLKNRGVLRVLEARPGKANRMRLTLDPLTGGACDALRTTSAGAGPPDEGGAPDAQRTPSAVHEQRSAPHDAGGRTTSAGGAHLTTPGGAPRAHKPSKNPPTNPPRTPREADASPAECAGGREPSEHQDPPGRHHRRDAHIYAEVGERIDADAGEPVTDAAPLDQRAHRGKGRAAPTQSEFKRFWEAYPRKVGRRRAEAAFRNACRRAPPDRIIDAAAEFAASPAGRQGTYTPHPTTWLNGDQFDDDRDEWNRRETERPQGPAHREAKRKREYAEPAITIPEI